MPQICQRGQGLISTFHSASVGFQRIIVAKTIPKVFSVRGVFDKVIGGLVSSAQSNALIVPHIAVVDISLRPVKPVSDVLFHYRVLPFDNIILAVFHLSGRNCDFFLLSKNLIHWRTIQPWFLLGNPCTAAEQQCRPHHHTEKSHFLAHRLSPFGFTRFLRSCHPSFLLHHDLSGLEPVSTLRFSRNHTYHTVPSPTQ